MKRRTLAAATLTPVGVLGVGGVAVAFWSVASTGATGTAAAAVLAAPSGVSTSAVTSSSVTINVTSAPSTGPAPTSYRVDRTGPSSAPGVCSISGITGSCNDPNPVGGQTNTYAVLSKLGDNWVSATSATTSASVPSSDAAAPTTSATPSPAANGAGWHKGDLAVLLSATDDVGGSGVKEITYSATGAQVISPSTVAGSSTSVGITTEGTTTLSFFASDNAGNAESTQSVTINLDKTGPSNVLSLTGATGSSSFLAGSTVYYRGSATGTLRVQNAVVDVLSNPASSTTSLTAAAGWTHTGSTVSTPPGGPYVSDPFTWAAATSTSPTATVTGTDVADNTSASSLTFTNDVTGPTGGSVTYSGVASTSSSVSVGFAAGTDAGAGVNAGSAVLQRASAAYVAGACEAFASFSTIAAAPAIEPFADTLPSDGCYKYQYVVSDNVGNATSYTSPNVVIRDTVTPTLTSLQVLDNNGNGKVDRVVATFSETLATYTAGNAPWTLANVPSSGSLASVSVATNTATLTVTEGVGATDTSVGAFTIALAADATGIRDAAGNEASFAASPPADGATPVRTGLVMQDANGNGKVDRVVATFSETLATYTAGNAPWALANVPSSGSLASASVAANTATLALTEGAGAASTAVGTFTVALASNANGIRDAVGNPASFAATAPADGAAPVRTAMLMQDTGPANGKVDRVQLSYSESLVATTTTSPWTLANVPSGGSLLSVATSTSTLTLTLTEGAGAADTSVGSFTVALDNGTSAVTDATGNVADGFTATAPTDGAGPVPTLLADTNGTNDGRVETADTFSVTFSEPILASSVASTTTLTFSRTGNGSNTISAANLVAGAVATGLSGNKYINGTGTSSFSFNATLGVSGASVTLTVGTNSAGAANVGTAGSAGTVAYVPSTLIKDAANNAATGSLPQSLRLF
jgi:acid phosphatase family membrane protein YuiD